MRLRLQSQFLMQTLALVLFVILTLSTVLLLLFSHSSERISEMSAQNMKETLTSRLVVSGRTVASDLAFELEKPAKQLDMRAIYERLQTVIKESGVEYVYVFDDERKIIHDGSHEIGHYGLDVDTLTQVGQGNILEEGVTQTSSHLVVTVPFKADSGGVTVGLSLAPIRTEASNIVANAKEIVRSDSERFLLGVSIATGVLMLITMVIALWLARNIVRPIRQLATYAGEVGKGNYDAILPIRRSDELGDLAKSLREMSDNLQVTSGEVHYLAYHDSLTKLPNRAQLKDALQRAVARAKRSETSAALLFIDLDDFKRVNDTLGHEAGDTLLKEFAVRLAESIRGEDQVAQATDEEEASDMIARLGGDEFTVVLDSIIEPGDVVAIAQRILAELKNPFLITGQEVVVGASIGITTYPEDGEDIDTLLRNADVAMYQAKERGKNQFEFYNDSMHRMATERLSLEADLRHALQYDQMRLVYQPILDLKKNEVVAIDSKVRWIHPALGVIHPDVFLPLAEQTGFIVELDEWVIKSVCSDLRMLQKRGFTSHKISAKLSSVHFRDHSIADVVRRALEQNSVTTEFLSLKIDEKTIMRNFPRASAILNELRDSGIDIVVDAFGSGHSPLNYLTKLPVDSVKIADEYIRQITHGEHEKAIVAIIVAMAHSLNMKVIADGVESAQQKELVESISCDMVQGSYYSRPMLRDDLITYLEKHVNGRNELLQSGSYPTGSLSVLKS